MKNWLIIGFFSIIYLLFCLPAYTKDAEKNESTLEKELINAELEDIQKLDKNIKVELKYSAEDNFLGYDVYGELEKCYLQPDVAKMLTKAQSILTIIKPGYKLLVYDCVRPVRVQEAMWKLVEGTEQEQYVADPKSGSIHNYGAAVDLTIIDEKGNPLDMGTPFDYFGKLAQPQLEKDFLKKGKLTVEQIKNRRILRKIMEKAGFEQLKIEWWHFNAYPASIIKKRYTKIN